MNVIHTPTLPLAGRREWMALAVLALPTLLLSIDTSVLYLALVPLSRNLGANSGQQLWIMDIYGFMMAGFLVTMGTTADRIGYRPLLLIGATGFSLASIMAAFSTSAGMLIAARALMGISGASLMPCTLGIIRNMFRDTHQRSTAISVWMCCFMGGMIVGPLVGGVILEHFHWGAVFLLGVPVMLLLLVTGPTLLPNYREGSTRSIDPIGVAQSLAAILPFIYGCTELARKGWGLLPVASLFVGLLFGAAFILRERRHPDPLIDLRLFSDKVFSAALVIMFVVAIAMGGMSVFIAQYLQMIEGLTPLRAGLWMIPQAVAMMIGFVLCPAAARRFRPGMLFAASLALSAIGMFFITRAGAAQGFACVIAGGIASALGITPAVSLGTGIVIGAAPPEKAGSAGSISETVSELGVALGVALLGSIGAALYRLHLSGPLPPGVSARDMATAREGIAAAFTLTPGLHTQAAAAYISGMRIAATVSALLLGGLAWVSASALKGVPPVGQEAA